MKDLVINIKYQVKIVLSDNTEIVIKSNDASNRNNITSINIDEKLNIQNNNPVGCVSSNTLKLEIDSTDRSLIPDNNKSPYYGKMNTEAYVDIQFIDTEGTVKFNRYFVNNWDSNIRNDNPYQVVIEGTDLLGIIAKNPCPQTELKKNITTTNTLSDILDKLNETLSVKYKIKYKLSDLDFSAFPKLEYNNLEADDMNTWFNILSQSTLSNIYLDRSDSLVVDYCLDDKASESVSNLSGKVNVTSASVSKGGLVSYTGVKVNYIINSINNNTLLLELKDQALTPGENRFDNIEMNGKIYKITTINVKTDQKEKARITSMNYNKRTVNLVINNESRNNANVSITIYGQTLKENKLYTTRNKTQSNEVLELTNRLLPKTYIEKYATNLLKLIGIKESALQIVGHFNPRIKLGDQVYVTMSSMNISGYYKVIGLNWKYNGALECTAKVIKTII